MRKYRSQKNIRRNVLDDVTRVAAEGLKSGNNTADILISILASIHEMTSDKQIKASPKLSKSKPKAKLKDVTSKVKQKIKQPAVKKRARNKPPHGFIKESTQAGIAAGKSNKEINDGIHARYSGAKTTPSTISWYRSQYLKKKN